MKKVLLYSQTTQMTKKKDFESWKKTDWGSNTINMK